jgi:hypothetical protein
MGAGLAKGLMKAFNKKGVASSLFVIFTPGGIDFVGGYSYYQFLMHNLFPPTGGAGEVSQLAR